MFNIGLNRALPAQLISHFGVDLSGLTVYTEAASGTYLLTPIVAALAGARKVFAQTRDSRFATAEVVCRETMRAASAFGVADNIEVRIGRFDEGLAQSDIVTNSGFVRPLDSALVARLKPTAVIPLMWETWEFRAADLDLSACKARGTLVLGTKEQEPPCDLRFFTGLFALKLLFELGFDGGKVLLLGNAPLPAGAIADQMRRTGIDLTWVSAEPEGDLRYEQLREHFSNHGQEYDIMVVAEHRHHHQLLGEDGFLDYSEILDVNPDLKLGIISGNIDITSLKASRLRYFPEDILPAGFLSYQPYHMGPRPVLTLYTAGLKVGEAMARARLRGLNPKDAAREALASSPAMDFVGDMAWL
ncbi:MAG: hypothetical protein HYX42_06530 [Polaromonas sp.]|uniref:hypothetical protein n=1 Tax=Polaromonas sp. TaxID=1869339 RepID=UPI0025EC8757|nr:hypothetical protein [Polaromonas sp.]MBI2725888.1 hypothetical protein [Polaromonas sp.]